MRSFRGRDSSELDRMTRVRGDRTGTERLLSSASWKGGDASYLLFFERRIFELREALAERKVTLQAFSFKFRIKGENKIKDDTLDMGDILNEVNKFVQEHDAKRAEKEAESLKDGTYYNDSD